MIANYCYNFHTLIEAHNEGKKIPVGFNGMESLLLSLLCRNLLHELLKTVVFKMPFLFAIGTQKWTGLDALPFPLFSLMLLGMKFIMLPAVEKLLFSLLQKSRVEKRIAAILISCTHCDVSSSGKER